MNNIKYLSAIITALILLISCTDTWDSHYKEQEEVINNDNIISISSSTKQYIESEASLSSMYALFKDTKVLEQIEANDHVTLLVVENENISHSEDMTSTYLAENHVAAIAISPANLINGERVLMQNKKYLNISTQVTNKGTTYYFNNAEVKKIIKTTDGYIYVLNSFAQSPKSLYETIESLGDNYSIFREMILSRNEKVFDKNASTPIDVDNTGSTIYDSVFIITNPYFNAKGFDLNSPALTATLLIPSNKVVNEAISTAKQNLKDWGMQRADSIIANWVFQSAFFKEQYTKNDFENNIDLKSVFDKQWRTTVQKVDLDNPIEMSNGLAYHIDWMKIPTNVLIYRVKDHFKWYEFLTQEDKEKYYQTENLTYNKCETKVAAWSGWPAGGFPLIENRVLIYSLVDKTSVDYSLKFTPFHYEEGKGGKSYTADSYKIPPGEYDLCLGFMQKKNNAETITISFNGKPLANKVSLGATTFHFDRGGQGYPEGYDTSKATDSKRANYDRDGGKVGVIEVTGAPKEIELTFQGKFGSATNTSDPVFHHWCLKPTANCY